MADVIPFKGLRYARSAGPLADLIAPPYDVISPTERESLYARNPHNIIRVEFGRDEAGDAPGRDKYARAREALRAWAAEGALARDERPAFYLTEHTFKVEGETTVRRGFLGALRIYPEGSDQVLPHERTIPKDRADRMSLLQSTRTNVSPIFGMVEDSDGRLAAALAAGRTPERLISDCTVGAERHQVWLLDGAPAEALARLVAPKRVYLADGHHRYETARAYLEDERAAGRSMAADDPAAFVLAFVCSLTDPGLRIFPTHRVVRGGRAALEAAASGSFDRAPIGQSEVAGAGIVLAADGKLERLTLRPGADRSGMPRAWHGLPIAEAEALVLDPARAAGANVTYTHDMAEALAAGRGETAAVLVAGVDGETIRRIADQGERMPQKTTYFYPKVPTGLVLRTLD